MSTALADAVSVVDMAEMIIDEIVAEVVATA